MILIGIFVLCVALILGCARALEDPTPKPRDDTAWFDALLFLLCVVGMLRKSKRNDDDTSL